MSQNRAQKTLSDLTAWHPGSESDSYPYFKDLFCAVLEYPKDKIKINDKELRGIPDITMYSKDGIPWVVCEVKPEPGRFRSKKERDQVWHDQLSRYVTADTVHALLLDPTTLVMLSPDGRQSSPIELNNATVPELRDGTGPKTIAVLAYDSSISSLALKGFVAGTSPIGYLDVSIPEAKEAFYKALRLSASELRGYAVVKVQQHFRGYDEYLTKMDALTKSSMGDTRRFKEQEHLLRTQYRDAIELREEVLEFFLAQIGREVPSEEEEQREFIQNVYATEAANLVLARILFVRFLEDYDMTSRKISNGGIALFRSFNRHVQNEYKFLLESAFQDSKAIYSRMFEESVFDWARKGDGELSRILLRVFYRLNAFDFKQITGDILGNLYERFLDPDSRKEMGEFYTPVFVVDYILDSVGFKDEPGPLLDPACGSGTFLFRAIEFAINSFRKKGVPEKDAIEQAVRIVHGLDINVFAAFIAQLQVIWHLLPHLNRLGLSKLPDFKLPDFNIYGGVDSLESGAQTSLEQHLVTSREDAAVKIRDARYKYIVGNPPYVRAERLKTATRWSDYYSEVATGKKDISFYFLYRALEGGRRESTEFAPWLEDAGTMGFIVSFGVADSRAGLALRKVLLRNRLRELADLEPLSNEVFTSQIASSRSTVAPIIVVASKSSKERDYNVKVTSATRGACLRGGEVDLKRSGSSLVPKSVFTDGTINPFLQFATKIQAEDVSVLHKLLGNKSLAAYAEPLALKDRTAIQVGIQTGTGKGKIFTEPGDGRFLMAKGSHIHAFVMNSRQISEYVDLSKAQNDSLWGYDSLRARKAYALAELGFAPQACIFNMGEIVAQKSCIVFVPAEKYDAFPWDIYLNSRIPRYVFGLVLRSALIEGSDDLWRAHINSDAVKLFPVPVALVDQGEKLQPMATVLRDLSDKIVSRWQRIDNAIRNSEKTTLALLRNVRYVNVTDFKIFRTLRVTYIEATGLAKLQPFWRDQPTLDYIEGDKDALQVIKYMMDHPEFSITPSPGAEIPRDFVNIANEIRDADISRNPDIKKFKEVLEDAESIIAEAFSLTKKEYGHIKSRLNSPPFSAMQPRWPWTPAAVRTTRVYEEDRFA